MKSFSKTRAAAEYAAGHARAELTRARAAALLEQLAAWEMADGSGRQRAIEWTGLLRGLVIAVRDLAGASWLNAAAEATFLTMQATASPPDPDTIDETCSRVLWARFSSVGASAGRHPLRRGHGLGHRQNLPQSPAAP